MITYSVKIGHKKYKKLKGHLINYEKGFAELTQQNEKVIIIPIKKKPIIIDSKWLLNKKEQVKKISQNQADIN